MAKLFYRDVSGTTGTIELQSAPVLIGRATDCQIQTQDAQVSRRHARVIFDGSAYWIEDTGSANGVFVNNERVPRYQLKPGTNFRCGYLEVRFEVDGSAASPPGAAAPLPAPQPAAVPIPPSVAAPAVPIAVPVSAPPPVVPAAAVPSAELTSLRNELEGERRKRTDLEFELSELKRKIEELQARPAPAATGEADSERLRRRVEQLESELKRKGAGGAAGGASVEALRAAEAERDRLRARVSELESKVSEPSKTDDQEMELIRLRRRVEQLEADLRRVRGGKAAEPSSPASAAQGEALVTELEEKVRRLIEERDEAVRKASHPVLVAPAAAAPTDPRIAEELERAKRRIDQLESELRRKPVGQVADTQRVSEQRVELESALRQLRDVEKERDSLRELVAQSAGNARPPKAALDGLLAVSDGLADIRAAIRAAGDDVALEQLEQLRSTLRQACISLGLTV